MAENHGTLEDQTRGPTGPKSLTSVLFKVYI